MQFIYQTVAFTGTDDDDIMRFDVFVSMNMNIRFVIISNQREALKCPSQASYGNWWMWYSRATQNRMALVVDKSMTSWSALNLPVGAACIENL